MTEQAYLEGGCHCGAIRFRVRGVPSKVLVCNCSICTMKAYLHWIVDASDFELLDGDEELSTYRFNTGVAAHHFCRHCGVAPFYIARSDPDGVDVNARCVRGLDLASLAVETFDGRNWEAHYETYEKSR